MKLSTRHRYAVMAIIDLVVYSKGSRPVTLQAISERQRISATYLEKIFLSLKNQGIVASVKGPGGGYVLTKDASSIAVADIVSAMDSRAFKMTRCSQEICLRIKIRILDRYLKNPIPFGRSRQTFLVWENHLSLLQNHWPLA